MTCFCFFEGEQRYKKITGDIKSPVTIISVGIPGISRDGQCYFFFSSSFFAFLFSMAMVTSYMIGVAMKIEA